MNWEFISSRFITFFKFTFSTREERGTIFLYWLFVHRQLSTHWLNQRERASHSPQTHWPRPGPKNQLALSKSKSQLTAFYSKSLRIPTHRFWAWRHSQPQSYFLSGVFIVRSLDITYWTHARKHLPLMCAPN